MAVKLPFLSGEHHFAIANVAAYSATLDQSIERLVYIWFGDPKEITEFVLKNLSFDRLIELLRIMYEIRLPKHKDSITELFKAVKRSRGERNQIIHWMYEKTDASDTVQFRDRRPYRSSAPKRMSALDIQKVADDLHECTNSLIEWSVFADWYLCGLLARTGAAT
jgi:hypothetical protein